MVDSLTSHSGYVAIALEKHHVHAFVTTFIVTIAFRAIRSIGHSTRFAMFCTVNGKSHIEFLEILMCGCFFKTLLARTQHQHGEKRRQQQIYCSHINFSLWEYTHCKAHCALSKSRYNLLQSAELTEIMS